jgi:hypothetical protein
MVGVVGGPGGVRLPAEAGIAPKQIRIQMTIDVRVTRFEMKENILVTIR